MDKRIGAQLYTLRDFCKTKEDLDASFEKISKIGYKVVQVSGIGDIKAEDIKEVCDKYGIKVACTHKSMDDFQNNIQGMIDFHKTIDCDIAGIGIMPENYRANRDLDTIMQCIEELNKIHAELKKAGISFAYHNHAFEFEKINGKFIMDYMLEKGEFDFILDVYWLSFSGINPADYIRKLGKRAVVIHYKDLAIENDKPIMAEVMEGNLDWDAIIKASEEAGARWAMVEQDICKNDPFDSLELSYNNLTKKGFN